MIYYQHLLTAVTVKTKYRFDLHDKVVTEEHETDDGEEVDEDDGQHGSEHDGAAVARHRADHVEEGLLSVDHVQQL